MEVKEQCVVLIRNGAGFACIGNRSSPAGWGQFLASKEPLFTRLIGRWRVATVSTR